MARKKTTLAYIANPAARRTTFKKRRAGLLKKIHELSVLCDVPACAIIYSPEEKEAVVWPSSGEAGDILNRFNSAEGISKSNNMMNQEKFLCKQIEKIGGRLGRLMAENDEIEGEVLLLQCLGGRSVGDFGGFELGLIGGAIARRIAKVKDRILMIENGGGEVGRVSAVPVVDQPVVEERVLGWEPGLFPGFETFFQPTSSS